MIGAGRSSWLQKGWAWGAEQCPRAHPVVDISESIIANIFLLLLPASQEAGPESQGLIGRES